MAKSNNRAKSAQKETTKRVNNRRRAAEKAAEAIPMGEAVEVESVEAVEVESVPAAVPAVKEAESGKVSSKDVLRAAGNLRAAVKEERRGANCTIRLIAERAASGDASAVDVLCALCDIPRSALFSLNIDTIRAAVNAWYPYYIETEGRKVSVKPVGLWYSTQKDGDVVEDAARVRRGYRVTAVADYLDQLIKAAKSRAKGVQPRRVDADAIYNDIALSDAADDITATEIDEAKQRKAYSPNGVNVWHKDRTGFYI